MSGILINRRATLRARIIELENGLRRLGGVKADYGARARLEGELSAAHAEIESLDGAR